MKVLFLVCAQSAVIDQQTNALSVFNILQELNSPSFPFAIAGFTVASFFMREPTELEDPTNVRLQIHLQGKQLANFDMALQFQGRRSLRHIANVQGLIFTEPGELRVSVHHADQEIGYWPVPIQNIGAPQINAADPSQ